MVSGGCWRLTGVTTCYNYGGWASEIRWHHQLKTLVFTSHYLQVFGFQPSQIGAGFLRTIHRNSLWISTPKSSRKNHESLKTAFETLQMMRVYFSLLYHSKTSHPSCVWKWYTSNSKLDYRQFSHLKWWFWGIPHFQTNPNGWRNHEKSPYFLICSTQIPMVHYVSWSTSFSEALTSYFHANSTVSSWYP